MSVRTPGESQAFRRGPDERFEFGLNVLISGLAASKV